MLVDELFIILLDISGLYAVRYLTTICMFFSLNKLLDIFGPIPGPLPQNRAQGQHTLWPPSHLPWALIVTTITANDQHDDQDEPNVMTILREFCLSSLPGNNQIGVTAQMTPLAAAFTVKRSSSPQRLLSTPSTVHSYIINI